MCRADEHAYARSGTLILCSKCGNTIDLLSKPAPKPRKGKKPRTLQAPQEPLAQQELPLEPDQLEAEIAAMIADARRSGVPPETVVENITSAATAWGNREERPPERVPVDHVSDTFGPDGL